MELNNEQILKLSRNFEIKIQNDMEIRNSTNWAGMILAEIKYSKSKILRTLITHRRARWVLPNQARFKILSCLISKSSKNQEFIKTTSQFQARSENLKSQNLNFKQDPRI